MNKQPILKIELCSDEAILPKYIHYGDAGMDLFAAEDIILKPGETKAIALGFKAVIPYGYEVQIRPRSGLSFKTRLRMPNSVGTIDSGFRDEWKVLLHNSSVLSDPEIVEELLTVSEKDNRPGTYQILKGDRIAQMIVSEVCEAKWEIVADIANIGTNRGGGFGSSGTR